MKTFIKSIRFTLIIAIFLSVSYILVLWIFAQFASPNMGNAEVVTLNGRIVGVSNIGQNFSSDKYFWGRPSCAGDGYDGSSSSGSNKGVSNQEYLKEVSARTDSFLIHHPYLKRNEIPAELVTASASGLDPHITPECAYVQIKRVASARHMSEEEIRLIVEKNIEKPFLNLFGTAKINVLKLNVALDQK